MKMRLLKKINELGASFSCNPTETVSTELKNCKDGLETLYQIKTNGCIVGSRANFIEFCERNSKYFINLEKRNQKRKVIKKLILDNGDILTSGNEILDEENCIMKSCIVHVNQMIVT